MRNESSANIDLTVLPSSIVEHYGARARIERAQAIADLLIACRQSFSGLLHPLWLAGSAKPDRITAPEVARCVELASR